MFVLLYQSLILSILVKPTLRIIVLYCLRIYFENLFLMIPLLRLKKFIVSVIVKNESKFLTIFIDHSFVNKLTL